MSFDMMVKICLLNYLKGKGATALFLVENIELQNSCEKMTT